MGTYVNKVDGARKPSILASEVGLITRPASFPQPSALLMAIERLLRRHYLPAERQHRRGHCV